jgi:hypothetical protein
VQQYFMNVTDSTMEEEKWMLLYVSCFKPTQVTKKEKKMWWELNQRPRRGRDSGRTGHVLAPFPLGYCSTFEK